MPFDFIRYENQQIKNNLTTRIPWQTVPISKILHNLAHYISDTADSMPKQIPAPIPPHPKKKKKKQMSCIYLHFNVSQPNINLPP